MKKKVFVSIAIVTIIALMIIGGYTLAKYFNFNSAEGNAKIAKWSVNSTFQTNGVSTTDIKLVNTYNPETLVEDKIAPGTSGQFDIVIDATGTETGLNYVVKFVDGKDTVKPKNLKFTALGTTTSNLQDLEDVIKGTINANATDKIVTIPVTWQWPYETLDEDGSATAGDAQDTSDGETLSDYNFTVNVTCTQVAPVSK